MNLQPGQILGDRFAVERLIGEGGMAVVWLVRHTVLGTPYALKILTVTHPSVTERLVREGQVQGQLDHPNVVRVHDVLELEGHRALVMDYVEGPDLEGWIASEKPDLETALQVFRGVCAAVSAAHARGLVHRDLKPANVLMAKTPNGWVPKVADFGLAKVVEGEGIQKTRTGMAMGTPAFMAPEQIRDASSVDARADVFALGCILYQLVTGEQAFEGPDVMTVWMRITSGDYVRAELRKADLPPAVVRSIDGALLTDPDQRLPSVEAMLGVLDGAVVPMRVEPPRAPPPAPWIGYAAAMAAVIGLGGAALIGAGAMALGVWWTADAEAPPADAVAVGEVEGHPDAVVAALEVCSADDEKLIGWARTGKVRLTGNLRNGMTWKVTAPVGVSKEVGDPAFCQLPEGTVVEIVQNTRKIAGLGTFAPIVGGHFTTPGW